MRILAISDIHSSMENLQRIKETLIHNNFDLCVIAGDLTNFGAEKETIAVLEKIWIENVFAIMGNLDTAEVLETIEKQGVSIHAKKKIFQEHCFIGFGGGRIGADAGRCLFEEKELRQRVLELAKGEKNVVLAIHVPPFNSKLDVRKTGEHIGSYTVRKVIEKIQPRLFLCGHVHESFGQENIGKTVCLNVASVKEGRAAVIELGKKISVKWIKVEVQ